MAMFKCKKCNNEKLRLRDGNFGGKLSPKYRDECGNLWNGKVCPDCKRDADKMHKRKVRNASV